MRPPAIRRSIRGFLRHVGAFVYPPVCEYCRTPLVAEPEGQSFCDDCYTELRPEDGEQCRRCGAPLGPHLGGPADCHYCRKDRFRFESVARFGVYDGLLRSVCLAMKQPDSEPLIDACGELLWNRAEEQLRSFAPDGIVFVPHYRSPFLRRRHNSAEVLARVIGRKLKVPVDHRALRKTRKTPPQLSLTPTERRNNLRGAFQARLSPRLRDATLLLVDDVLTTGSTAHESARALVAAGAKRVFVAVLARGLGRDFESSPE